MSDFLLLQFGEQGMAQWWEHLPSTNVAWIQIPASTHNYVVWVCCWFSLLLWEVFLRVLRFSPLLKNQHFQIPIQPGIVIYYLFNSPTDNKKWSNGETTVSLVERAENSHWQAPQFRRYRPWRRRTHTYFSYVQCGLQAAIEGKITSNTLRDVNCMVWRSHFLHPMYPELLAKREVNTANIGHILCLYEPLH